MTSSIVQRAEAARRAVAEACHVCRAVQRASGETSRLLKDDRSPVSVADFAAQAVVAHRLREALGSVTLVAEEDAAELRTKAESGEGEFVDAVVQAVRVAWPEATLDDVLEAIDLGNADPMDDGLHGFWTLDPIDGTKGFLRGQQYAVSLAWVEGAAPVIGVLGCPNLSMDFSASLEEADPDGTLYAAIAGDGVGVCRADEAAATGPMTPLRRLERGEGAPVRMCESVESSHAAHEKHAAILAHLGEAGEPARLDSQAKYAVVARGQADLYLRLPRPPRDPQTPWYVERIWDHAAGALVATECGCAVSDLNGNPLDFSQGLGLEKNRGVVVAPAALHARAIEAISAIGIRTA